MFAIKNNPRRKSGLRVTRSFEIMPYFRTSDLKSVVVGTHTALFQIQKLYTLSTEYVCVFHIILTTKRDYFYFRGRFNQLVFLGSCDRAS